MYPKKSRGRKKNRKMFFCPTSGHFSDQVYIRFCRKNKTKKKIGNAFDFCVSPTGFFGGVFPPRAALVNFWMRDTRVFAGKKLFFFPTIVAVVFFPTTLYT